MVSKKPVKQASSPNANIWILLQNSIPESLMAFGDFLYFTAAFHITFAFVRQECFEFGRSIYIINLRQGLFGGKIMQNYAAQDEILYQKFHHQKATLYSYQLELHLLHTLLYRLAIFHYHIAQ